jgi:D-alanyl-D-alanine carboxypeptidase
MIMRNFLILPMLLLAFHTSLTASSSDSTDLAKVVATYLRSSDFSGTILVAKGGEPVYHRSFGLAHRGTSDTIRNNYRFAIASVTKLFTGIRILQLQQNGQLNLTDPVVKYLPQFQSLIGPAVSIHHLLLHISGLPEEKNSVYRHGHPIEGLVAESLRENRAGTFEAFNYNNIDYMLLGLVVEAVTGKRWQQNIEEAILQPLEMTNTGFLKYGEYPARFAYAYQLKGQRLVKDPTLHMENFYAAGNMYASASDLLKLDQALYTDILLDEPARQLLRKSYPAYNYVGYSVWNYQYPFVDAQPTVMERRGGILGANVVLVRLLDDHYTIIILSNDNRFNPDSFGDSSNLREKLIRALYVTKS